MFNIFDYNESASRAKTKLKLGRLQEVLEVPTGSLDNGRPKGANPGQVVHAMPAVTDSQPRVNASVELQQFVEQFARGFLESLGRSMNDLQALLSEDRKKLATGLDELRLISRETQTVLAEFAKLRIQVEGLENDRQQLNGRLDKVEQSVNRSYGALRNFEDIRLQVEKRLDLQAGAIRSLHDAVQSRDENLNKLLVTLQAMQTVAAGATVPKALSDEL